MTVNQVEKIEKFLEGKMGAEEQKSFEEALLSDDELFAVYKTYSVIATTMVTPQKSVNEKDVQSTLNTLRDEFFPAAQKQDRISSTNEPPAPVEITVPGTSLRKYRVTSFQTWIMAAAALGIIVMGTWYALKDKKDQAHLPVTTAAVPYDPAGTHRTGTDTALHPAGVTNMAKHEPEKSMPSQQLNSTIQQELFAEYFKPDTRPGSKEELLEDAFDLYERRHYTEAVAAFENAEPDLSTRGEETDLTLARFYVVYYKALSYMAVGKDQKALNLLKNLTGPDPTLQAKVAWYLALIYIRKGDIQKATSLLNAINGNKRSPEYSEKARELMIKLSARK